MVRGRLISQAAAERAYWVVYSLLAPMLLGMVGVGCRSEPSDSTSPRADASVASDGGERDASTGCAAPADPTDIDFLFVLGASSESADVQQQVLGAIDDLVPDLGCALGARPNIQLGFVNADLGVGPFSIPRCTASGSEGLLERTAKITGCSPPSGSFLIDVAGDGERVTNFDGALADAARCIGAIGNDGCAFEQPLAAAALATAPSINPGLVREGALLVVIMASGADDCSATAPSLFDPESVGSLGPLSPFRCFHEGVVCDPDSPTTEGAKSDCSPRNTSPLMANVGDVVTTLRSRKTDPEDVIVATIGGDPQNVSVSVDGGQAELGLSCDPELTELRAGSPIRLAAAGQPHLSVCPAEDAADDPESLFDPLIDSIVAASN